MWTLFFSVVGLHIAYGDTKLKEWHKWILIILLNFITFPADWSCIGLMIIISMYPNRNNIKQQMKHMMLWISMYAVVSFIFVNKVYSFIQLFVILAYPLLKNYNNEKGKIKWLKWFFYIYYPLHLIVIGILRLIVHGNIPLLFN